MCELLEGEHGALRGVRSSSGHGTDADADADWEETGRVGLAISTRHGSALEIVPRICTEPPSPHSAPILLAVPSFLSFLPLPLSPDCRFWPRPFPAPLSLPLLPSTPNPQYPYMTARHTYRHAFPPHEWAEQTWR